MAISGDTILIGSGRIDFSGPGRSNAYVRAAGVWSHQQEILVPGDPSSLRQVALDGDRGVMTTSSGSVVRLSRSGTTWSATALSGIATGQPTGAAVVGLYTLASYSGGVAMCFNFALQQRLPDGSDGFGSRLALDGDTALVGAPTRVVGTHIGQGAAYVYVRQAGVWTLQAQLDGDGEDYAGFGSSVALEGNRALVNAYVFERSGATWSLSQKLTTKKASSALSGDTAVVGNEVYVRGASKWALQQTLVPSKLTGATDVALDGNTLALADDHYDGAFTDQGAIAIFERSGSTWTEKTLLAMTAPAAFTYFPASLALRGDTLLAIGSNAGYAFSRIDGVWGSGAQELKDGKFSAASLDRDTLVLGATNTDVGGNTGQGAAFVYVRNGTTWTLGGQLSASDGVASQHVGNGVAVRGSTILVGDGGRTPAALVFLAKGVLGGTCTINSDCGPGYTCADSVCCNTECVGSCSACSIAAGGTQDGVCTKRAAGQVPSPLCTDGNLLCDGSSTDCPANCKTDAGCLAGNYCTAAGTCTPGKANGVACALATDCRDPEHCKVCNSGNCVDGYCCNTACSDTCEACSTAFGAAINGQCGPRKIGPGEPECPGHFSCDGASHSCPAKCLSDAGCTAGYFCSGGTCLAQQGAGTPCTATSQCAGGQTCVDSVCCSTPCTEPCGACSIAAGGMQDGTCTAVGDGTAGGCDANVLCDGVRLSCPGGCGSDVDCGPGHYCDAHSKCVTKTAQGGSCDPAADCFGGLTCAVCKTGHCVDGVCCDTACDAACDTCVKREGADYDGYCTLRTAGTSGVPACDGRFSCDGLAAECPSKCASDSYCANGSYCDPRGACQPKEAAGGSCSDTRGCLSGLTCVDGVCCTQACGGTCEACNEPGKEGSCVAVEGAPRGERTQCPGAGECQGSCNGTKRDGCSFPDAATTCAPAACDEDSSISHATCDGSGECAEGERRDCGFFACDADSGECRTECSTNDDCKGGAVCDTSEGVGTCNATGSTCQGAFSVRGPDGTVSSCQGHRCVDGACQQACSKAKDCNEGYTCTDTVCVADDAAVGKKANDSGGCGCRVAAPRETRGAWLWLALVGATAVLRRRSAFRSSL